MLEIGCGSGAFIYCSNKYFKANYYGIDYSQNLINIAKKVLPNSNLILSEANSIPFNQVKFDVILSHSVFQYFVNHKYAFEVINEAFKKLNDNGSFCLLDLNDKKFENNYFIERKKKYKNYETAYKNLNHLFFDKIEIENYLLSIGFQKINFFPHAVKEYGNSNYRFNLIAKK